MGSQNLIVFHLTIRTSSFLAQFYLDLQSKVVGVNVSSLKFSSDLNHFCKWGHITLIAKLSANPGPVGLQLVLILASLSGRPAGRPTPSRIVISWLIIALNSKEKLFIFRSRPPKKIWHLTYLFMVPVFKWGTHFSNSQLLRPAG